MIPTHLNFWKVLLVAIVVGGFFIVMHGVGHKWNTQTCNICRLMS